MQTSNILRVPAAIKKTGISRSTIYTLLKTGEFPKPIKLSARSIGWLESELTDWIEQRASTRK
ncbi:MAG: AlpA family transcriptional regulator [Methylobacter sp.]|nr:AlpA family transcriptional regulator [Methylobacter sp.]